MRSLPLKLDLPFFAESLVSVDGDQRLQSVWVMWHLTGAAVVQGTPRRGKDQHLFFTCAQTQNSSTAQTRQKNNPHSLLGQNKLPLLNTCKWWTESLANFLVSHPPPSPLPSYICCSSIRCTFPSWLLMLQHCTITQEVPKIIMKTVIKLMSSLWIIKQS